MVLELMTGGELFERIVEKDHFSEKEAAEALRPIVDAL
jgi:calcium/calmodulin-dependent protein kinase I